MKVDLCYVLVCLSMVGEVLGLWIGICAVGVFKRLVFVYLLYLVKAFSACYVTDLYERGLVPFLRKMVYNNSSLKDKEAREYKVFFGGIYDGSYPELFYWV